MTWPWPTPQHLAYTQQALGAHPPQVQNPHPPYIPPPPPPIAQLLPPVNFYSNPPIPTVPPSFRQFSLPSPQLQQTIQCDANPLYFPSQNETATGRHHSRLLTGHHYQRRWNRRQSVRLNDSRSRNVEFPGMHNASRTVSAQQHDKKQNRSGQTSAQELVSGLNTQRPGSSPADTEGWVNARKANWPSTTNVEQKQAAALKRQEVGALDCTSRNAAQVKHRFDRSQRDLDASRNVLSRLNAKLPGSSPEEIEAWVRARKANWPSRRNVERKLAAAAEERNRTEKRISIAKSAPEALAKLADYSSSEDDDEKVERKQKEAPAKRGKRTRKKQGGRGKNNRSTRRLQVQNERKPTLLRMLLEREIRQEQSILLQAFRYIITKKASEMT